MSGRSEIYKNVLYLRKEHEKTQTEIAEYLNVRQTTYSKYKRGVIGIPIEVFIKLVEYYDVSIDYLVGRKYIF